ARADAQYCSNGNGRDANATKLLINQPQDVKVVQWWTQMVADGLALNTGRKTADAQAAFTAGRTAMTLESTGALRAFQTGAKFQVGTGFYPRSESGTSGGPIIGGASNWIMNARPKYEQNAAWSFIKFLNQPENQAYWHTHTGYFPTGKKALDDPSDVAWRQQFPQFQTAIDQLHQTKLDKATQGCLLGVMPKARQVAEVAIEKSILKQAEPKKALHEAVASIQPDIDQYNQQVH
ncbi:MAG: extracellular solute-binding protein, partial [Candidatus Dormibacteraeota bacterium]|nr:extracellular solute-binding protein [Candidatus Dormibacteraeota bacterium]